MKLTQLPIQYDALIIGGGPSGSTVGILLAKAGLKVLIFEESKFPRFHVGESLLPATNHLFKRLGIFDKIKKDFPIKPGGKWNFGDKTILGNFAWADQDNPFQDHAYGFLVERSKFDKILLDDARKHGADVWEETKVIEVLRDKFDVEGLVVQRKGEEPVTIASRMVFDCSGQNCVIPRALKLRRPTDIRRMSVYAHFKCKAVELRAKENWFVGSMIENGWFWIIPIDDEKISIGMVLPVEEFQKVKSSPEQFLKECIDQNDFIQRSLNHKPILLGKVHVNGSMGHTSEQLVGPGWALVGDSAYFIDPCYSSGVHLAMISGEKAADAFIEARKKNHVDLFSKLGRKYEQEMRTHERVVTKFVKMFYMATKNPLIRWLVPRANNSYLTRKFTNFTGGDFTRVRWLVNMIYVVHQILNILPIKNKVNSLRGADLNGIATGKWVESNTEIAMKEEMVKIIENDITQ
ncbi:MAG: FAD-dependent oxidoreductase [Bacteriovoracaceae bacterium]|nr:FAD-dependent oxidoreductase [Bacteriovoracaceae bacterium]